MLVNVSDLKEKTDYQLAQLINNNTPEAADALNELYNRHSGVFALKIRGMYENNFFGSGVYYISDLWDDKNYIFYLACKDFNPTISNFCTHLGSVTWHYAKRKVNKAERNCYNCDSIEDYGSEVSVLEDKDYFETISNKEFFEQALDYLKESSDERFFTCIFKSYVENKTFQEIGDELGVTKQRVEQIIFAAKKRLRNYFSRNSYDLT